MAPGIAEHSQEYTHHYGTEDMTRKSLYSPETHQEVLDRIDRLSADSRPEWGKMNAAQMMAHCTAIQKVINGEEDLKGTPFIARLFKGMIRKAVVGDKPFSRSLRTHPQYMPSSDSEFETEKNELKDALERFVRMDRENVPAPDHPLFGALTKDERGWSVYKHLDHHLTQFRV